MADTAAPCKLKIPNQRNLGWLLQLSLRKQGFEERSNSTRDTPTGLVDGNFTRNSGAQAFLSYWLLIRMQIAVFL